MPSLPVSVAVCLVAAGSLALGADLPRPTGDAVVAPDAKLELLFTRTAKISGGLTEGPTVAPDGTIFFSDIPVGTDKGMIMRFNPQTRQTEVFVDDSRKSNGLKFGPDGNLYACEGADYGGRSLVRYDIKTKQRTVLADRFQGKRFNSPNDLTIDRQGRVYFSDPKYLGPEMRELEHRAVYRVDPDGKVTEFSHDIEKPNGVALSPDEKTLYVADHNNGTDSIDPNAKTPPRKGAMKIYAFPLGADGFASGPKKTIYDFGDQAGCDGMTVDIRGHIYLTSRGVKRPGVLVIDPTGREVAFIPTGLPDQTGDQLVGFPSNVTFGIGDERQTLYITVDTSLFRIRTKIPGHISWLR